MNEIFENWDEVKGALVDGLPAKQQVIVAQLLENQKDQMITETAVSGSTAAHSIAGFRKIMLPMIRRIIPGTIATELVGVQPMTGPVGLVYTLRHRYAEAATATAVDAFGNVTPAGDIAVNDEVFGNGLNKGIKGFYSGGNAAEAAGASGLGAPAVANIPAADGANHAWPSSTQMHLCMVVQVLS
jgi:hypothetical protein